MSLRGLKEKTVKGFYNKEYKKLNKKSSERPTKIVKVGVLASSRLFGGYDITRNLSQKLGVDARNLEIIIFENLKDDFVSQHYNTFTEKDFGMYGKLKAQNLKEFVATKYDMLINYCAPDSIYGNLVTLLSNAKMKVSFGEEEVVDMYDFTVVVESNKIDVFNDELAKYLQILQLI